MIAAWLVVSLGRSSALFGATRRATPTRLVSVQTCGNLRLAQRHSPQREEPPLAPYADQILAILVRHGELDQLVENLPQQQSLQAVSYHDIGPRLAAVVLQRDSDRMLGPGLDPLVQIGAKAQDLASTLAAGLQLDSREGRVLDVDSPRSTGVTSQ